MNAEFGKIFRKRGVSWRPASGRFRLLNIEHWPLCQDSGSLQSARGLHVIKPLYGDFRYFVEPFFRADMSLHPAEKISAYPDVQKLAALIEESIKANHATFFPTNLASAGLASYLETSALVISSIFTAVCGFGSHIPFIHCQTSPWETPTLLPNSFCESFVFFK